MLKRKTWNLYAVYTVIFCNIVLHVNSVDSRYIFDTCCVHLSTSVALLRKDIAVIRSCGATFSMGESVHKNHYTIARFRP